MNVKHLDRTGFVVLNQALFTAKTGIFSGIFHFGARHSVFLLLCSSLNFICRLNPTDQGFTEIGEHPWLSALEVHSFSKALVPRAYL
jgi:hypothetical protein